MDESGSEIIELEDALRTRRALAKAQGLLPDTRMFKNIQQRIYEILK